MIHQMKKTYGILVMLISLILTGNLFAQWQSPPMLPDSTQIVKMVDELAESLSLTEEQKTEITELHFSHFEEAKELIQEHKSDRESHRKAMDDLRQDFDNQLKELLDDDQKAEFEELVKNRKPHPGQQRPGRR